MGKEANEMQMRRRFRISNPLVCRIVHRAWRSFDGTRKEWFADIGGAWSRGL